MRGYGEIDEVDITGVKTYVATERPAPAKRIDELEEGMVEAWINQPDLS